MARPGIIILLMLCLTSIGLPGICASIAQVQAGPQWIQVSVTGVVTLVEPGECYLQDINRSAGIRVIGDTTGIAAGHAATATGTFAVIDGEAAILDAAITATGTTADPVPLSMKNAAIAGRGKWSALSVCDFTQYTGWRPAAGLTNTGLLIKTWGTVEAAYSSATTGAKWFYINDGSNSVSDYGDTGILVYSDANARPGQFVCVTGISSAEPSLDSPDRLVRVIRTRTADDVQVLHEPKKVLQFSDEFDGPELDKRWMFWPDNAQISLTDMPGWLTLSHLSVSFNASTSLIQWTAKSWELEIRFKTNFVFSTDVQWEQINLVLGNSSVPNSTNDVEMIQIRGYSNGNINVKTGPAQAGPFSQDNYWLRFSSDGERITGSFSLDGVSYSEPKIFTGGRKKFLRLEATMYPYGKIGTLPFKAHIDYFRYRVLEDWED